jgi:hypothetical protein
MKSIVLVLILSLGIVSAISVLAIQGDGKPYEAALEKADTVESVAIANRWSRSEREVRSYVNSEEIVFQLPGGGVKKIRLSEEKRNIGPGSLVGRPWRHKWGFAIGSQI